MKAEFIKSKRIALDVLRYAFDKTYSASDILDGKLQNILNYSSVIVSISSMITASTLIDKVGIYFWLVLLIVLLLYITTFFVIRNGLKPRKFSLPISQNLDTIKSQYYLSTEDRAIEQSIVDHIHYTKLIEKENNLPKKRAINIASWLITIIVTLLMLDVPIGLAIPHPTLSEFLQYILP